MKLKRLNVASLSVLVVIAAAALCGCGSAENDAQFKFYGKKIAAKVRDDSEEGGYWVRAPATDEILFRIFFPNHFLGSYVEVGAADGVKESSTKFFEEERMWKGTLIEPQTQFFDAIRKYRQNAHAIRAAVCEKASVHNLYDQGLTTHLDTFDASNNNAASVTEQVSCQPLMDLLQSASAGYQPSTGVLDLLSVDAEGAELASLKTFDFRKVSVGVVLIDDSPGCYFKAINRCNAQLKKDGFCLAGTVGHKNYWVNTKRFDHSLCAKPFSAANVEQRVQDATKKSTEQLANSASRYAAMPVEQQTAVRVVRIQANIVGMSHVVEPEVYEKLDDDVVSHIVMAGAQRGIYSEVPSAKDALEFCSKTSAEVLVAEAEDGANCALLEFDLSKAKALRTVVLERPGLCRVSGENRCHQHLEKHGFCMAGTSKDASYWVRGSFETHPLCQELFDSRRLPEMISNAAQKQQQRRRLLSTTVETNSDDERAPASSSTSSHAELRHVFESAAHKMDDAEEAIRKIYRMNSRIAQNDASESMAGVVPSNKVELELIQGELQKRIDQLQSEVQSAVRVDHIRHSLDTVFDEIGDVIDRMDHGAEIKTGLNGLEDEFERSIRKLGVSDESETHAYSRALIISIAVMLLASLLGVAYLTGMRKSWRVVMGVNAANTALLLLASTSQFVLRQNVLVELKYNHWVAFLSINLMLVLIEVPCMCFAMYDIMRRIINDKVESMYYIGLSYAIQYLVFINFYVVDIAQPCTLKDGLCGRNASAALGLLVVLQSLMLGFLAVLKHLEKPQSAFEFDEIAAAKSSFAELAVVDEENPHTFAAGVGAGANGFDAMEPLTPRKTSGMPI
eukprot:CAMPEP_0185843990 /NCGR_PEP_ID=MMETSP1354-20130828/321_1 /TAXON_ID=708628 /ORGANISM="Erythrolobus madagascarensis, Strain CCMP3276" /LENGTH=847 /DNA_ID=CAMNT_0028543593 /DNA_START=173 /DNA_END=2716 /DNA_ORIENTATION=-